LAGTIAPKRQSSLKAEFAASLPWPLDAFQEEAIDKLDAGAGVLVCAPTSSGKTVVAEYAIFRALAEGVQVIYTTPLKALSNQKFRDFQRAYGEEVVGLVTGENTINELAPIVVMTTEILRNVIYEDPQRLREVSYVILDEVHYIDDFPRGSVWEEIVIQAPAHMKLVGLSATIGNYRELADWMSQNRGRIDTVYTDRRPVELRLWLSIQNRFQPLFGPDGGVDQQTWAKASTEEEAAYRVNRFRSLPSNDLLHVVAELERLKMLPAIYFIFSRRGCREALQRCAYHSLDLTTDAQKATIDAVAAERVRSLKDPDETALYNKMVDGGMLRRGLAVHHAGLLPFHKELVEELFAQGLIKVVFATETLSLGINMPARAVVVSSFTKFDGVNFSNLTTGELTQLMGRAGRRGIDTLGHGIIAKEADVEIGTIYEVAMGEGLVVESKFLPNYNMVLNLLRIHPAAEAEKLMQRSFGQYQKLLAASQTRERLINLEERLRDLEKGMGVRPGLPAPGPGRVLPDRGSPPGGPDRAPPPPPGGVSLRPTEGKDSGPRSRPGCQAPAPGAGRPGDQSPRRGGARPARHAAQAEDRPLPPLRRPRRLLRRHPSSPGRVCRWREGGLRPVRRVRPQVPPAPPGADRDRLPERGQADPERVARLPYLRREHAGRDGGDGPRPVRGIDRRGVLRGARHVDRGGPDAGPRATAAAPLSDPGHSAGRTPRALPLLPPLGP